MDLAPLRCYRPHPHKAQDFVSLPYDVFSDEEARAAVCAAPHSFLAIDRPETSFAPGQDPHAAEVYQRAQALMQEALSESLIWDEEPAFYLYELCECAGKEILHRQIGLVAAAKISDYKNGTLKRHELTRTDKQEDRVQHIKACKAQTGPIFCCYKPQEKLDAYIEDLTHKLEPIYSLTKDATTRVSCDPHAVQLRQRVWRVAEPGSIADLQELCQLISRSYIADGHHRAAAAAAVWDELSATDTDAQPAAERLLAVFFPANQLQVKPYDRIVRIPEGMDEDKLITALQTQGIHVSEAAELPYTPEAPGHACLYAFGHFRELSFQPDATSPSAALDVSFIQERVLKPIFMIDDPRTDPRIRFAGGIEPAALAELVENGECGIALFPTTAEQLMAVADADELMPPKSTWFEPKLRSGFFVRPL